ncbi:hypothetical protein [Nocardia sp. NPDC051463]|uniref:hypothetical protein n=1 Tax=Nocardia sp. NPDC051463 TaxID=3154845 RepID=UPI003412F538
MTDEAVHAIRYLCVESEAAYIVLAGIPHFVTRAVDLRWPRINWISLTHVADTLDVLSDFAGRLEEYGERVHLMPFGWKVASRAEISTRRWDLPAIAVSASREVHRFRGRSR